MEQEYLQMKHILFARENTAWKTWKDDKKYREITGKSRQIILCGKAQEYSKSLRLDDTIGWKNFVIFVISELIVN